MDIEPLEGEELEEYVEQARETEVYAGLAHYFEDKCGYDLDGVDNAMQGINDDGNPYQIISFGVEDGNPDTLAQFNIAFTDGEVDEPALGSIEYQDDDGLIEKVEWVRYEDGEIHEDVRYADTVL